MFQGVGGHLGWQPKSNLTFKLTSVELCLRFCNLLILDLNIFIIVATVPTGLQTCAKVLQMHLSGGRGTPWWQPKSYVKFKLASAQLLKIFTAYFGFKYFHYGRNCAHRVANLC